MAKRSASRERKSESGARTAAEALAITALRFIAAEPERLARFLAVTGLAPESIRTAARERHFLSGVLDHVAADEPLLLAFAAESGFDPNDVIRAHDLLSGRHWKRELP